MPRFSIVVFNNFWQHDYSFNNNKFLQNLKVNLNSKNFSKNLKIICFFFEISELFKDYFII